MWINYGGAIAKGVGCLVGAALVLMLSIVNDAVASKGADGVSVGGSVLSLLAKYVGLLFSAMLAGKRIMVLASLALAAAGAYFTVSAIASDAE